MKILIVYYSRTGVTKKVVEILKQKLNCYVEEIISVKDRKGLIGYLLSGREAMKGILAEIKPLAKNLADYDLVIIGTPVWGFNMSSPIRTFIVEQKEKLKKVAFLATMGGSGHERTFKNMVEIIGRQPIATLEFKTLEVKQNKMEEKINNFVDKLK